MKNLPYVLILLLAITACHSNNCKMADSILTDSVKAINDTVIQRKILGLTLGETTLDSALSILSRQGINMEREGRNLIITMKGVDFGGRMWDAFSVLFYDSKICRINFFKIENDFDKFKEDFNSIASDLDYKYRPLNSDTTTVKSMDFVPYVSYMDDQTIVSASLTQIGSTFGYSLDYEDCNLQEKYRQESSNEL